MIVCVRGVKNLPMIISNYPSFWRVSLQGYENIKRIRFSEEKIPQSEPLPVVTGVIAPLIGVVTLVTYF